MKRLSFAAVLAGAMIACSFFTAQAHHATSAYYNVDRTAEITGTVRDYRLVNPHLRLQVDVPNDGGGADTWLFEGPVAGDLRRAGWTQESVSEGETITVTFNPARNPNFKGGHVVRIVKQDGTTLTEDGVTAAN